MIVNHCLGIIGVNGGAGDIAHRSLETVDVRTSPVGVSVSEGANDHGAMMDLLAPFSPRVRQHFARWYGVEARHRLEAAEDGAARPADGLVVWIENHRDLLREGGDPA